jgi:NDP-sugar pyrophosphorylase family protein
MAVIPNPAPDHYNGVMADAQGAVTGFIPKGHAEASWHFVGVQVVRARVFDGLADGVSAETVSGVYRSMVAASPGRIRIWRTDATFHDVGTPADYLAAVLAISGAGSDASVIDPTAHVAGSARIARSVVWANTHIRDDVSLDACIVAGAAVVPPGLEATRQVIVPVTLATADDRCERQGGVALFPLH